MILKLLLLILAYILVPIVHIRARDNIIGVLYQILVAIWIGSVLRWRSYLVLVLIFSHVLAEWLILARLKHTARPVFIHVEFLILLVWVLASWRIWNLLGKKCHIVFATILMMLDFGHLIGTNLLLSMSSWIRTAMTATCVLAMVWVLHILAIRLKHVCLVLTLICTVVFY